MGCSASCPTKFITPHHKNPTSTASSSSSPSNSQLNSPYYTFSDTTTCPSATPYSKSLSLVHHPPMRKGDSSHFVSLMSSTYGSLILNDLPNPDSEFQECVSPVKEIQDFGVPDDPSSPDSVINTWELMAGLDEVEFNENRRSSEIVESYEFIENSVSSKSLWEHLSYEILKMGSTKDFRLEEAKHLQMNGANSTVVPDNKESHCCLPVYGDRIVLYYTSLRGIRKTYEDCCFVRMIFRGFRVCVDEKDISMDRSYRMELQDALKGKLLSLPQVFIRGKHIGGIEEIKQLNESGELVKLLEGFPLIDLAFVCGSCGDARFVPCPRCNGSRKVYEEEELELVRCPDCNENGLIRCSVCCT